MKKRSIAYLIDIAEQIRETSALETKQIAFIPRVMATASLPVSKQQDNEFIRRNGNRTLTMLASREIGLPYGATPRLALCAITTLSKQNQSNIISLGPSTAHFLNIMGKSCTGLWQPNSPYRWQSQLILTDEFYQHTQQYAIPIDLRVLHACGHYPLAMDIYCWLTYRYYSLKRPITISWGDLMIQFGNRYQRDSHFKANFRNALDRVALFYPQARFVVDQYGIQLLPSPTHVPPRDLNHYLRSSE